MDVVKGFATLALVIFLFAGMPLGAAAEEGPSPDGQLEEAPPPFVEGLIEEAGVNSILVNGRYYSIEDAVIMDGHMKRLGKDALVEGAKVTLFFDGTRVMQITVSNKEAE